MSLNLKSFSALIGILGMVWSSAAQAQITTLTVRPAAPADPYVAEYSQAVFIEAELSSDAGAVAGERVTFRLAPAESDELGFVISDPLTDAQGVATARLTLVDGRFGGQTFEGADPDGRAYRITASFVGDFLEDAPECTGENAADAGVPDVAPTGLCDSTDEHELQVRLETASIEIQPGNQVALGDSLTLIAVLTDQNGNAAEAGTEIDGTTPAPIPDGEVSFFFDLDRDERPSLDERIGTGTSNGDGIATFTFNADPAVFPAGNFESGLMVQYGGDQRFALAGAAARIAIDPGAPDPDNTLIEVFNGEDMVEEAAADGQTRLLVRATLVDATQNPLGVDTPDFDVSFETDLGTFEGEAERDLVTGFYEQELRAPDNGGSATITAVVDGTQGATKVISFTSTGCQCSGSESGPDAALLAALLALCYVVFPQRRNRAARANTSRRIRSRS